MRHTSAENIKKICAYNDCKSIKELNSKESIHLNVFELNGYINISDFTKNALELYISCKSDEFKALEGWYGEDKNEKAKKILSKHKNKVHLDASYAGDFVMWYLGKTDYEVHFIEKITLRNENQVFAFYSYAFAIPNKSIRKMVKMAKINARFRNINNYIINDKNLDDDSVNNLINLVYLHNDNFKYDSDIEKLVTEIEILKDKIQTVKDQKNKNIKHISEQLSEINLNDKIDISKISKINFETKTLTNDDS